MDSQWQDVVTEGEAIEGMTCSFGHGEGKIRHSPRASPEKQWGKLSSKKVKELLLATKDIMQSSYVSGGAELKDFKNPFHVSKFELKVYGKKEDEYGNEVISSTTSDQRKSWYCPKVQK